MEISLVVIVINWLVKVCAFIGAVKANIIIPGDLAFINDDQWFWAFAATRWATLFNFYTDWKILDLRLAFFRLTFNKIFFDDIKTLCFCHKDCGFGNPVDKIIRHGFNELLGRNFHNLLCNWIESFRNFFPDQDLIILSIFERLNPRFIMDQLFALLNCSGQVVFVNHLRYEDIDILDHGDVDFLRWALIQFFNFWVTCLLGWKCLDVAWELRKEQVFFNLIAQVFFNLLDCLNN